ncbi:hypothetical protein [Borreliella mayonii]|nr:hypothetical protein [Borreliella mayonii]
MINKIILFMCVFSLLNSCNSDHDTGAVIKNMLTKQKTNILMK